MPAARNPQGGRTRRWRLHFPGAATLLTGLIASLWLFHGLLLDPVHRTLGAGSGDPAQMAWFLAWTPHALLHGNNPFLSDYLYWPDGLNLMWNTAMPLPGLLLSPITLLLGPVASFNVLLVLGPAVTTWTARLWLGRHVSHPAAAVLGAVLIGFGPFTAAHAQGHVNFLLLGLVPVILMLIEEVLWRHPGGRSGALLGVTCAAQALTSEEVLLLLAGGVAVALLGAALARPHQLARLLLGCLPGLAVALAVFIVILAPALFAQLVGPHQVTTLRGSGWSARLPDLVHPTERMLFHGSDTARWVAARGFNSFEIDGYLGWPLLLLLGVVTLVVRDWRLHVGLLVATVSVGLSLGPATTLGVGAHARHVRLPDHALFSVYGLRSLQPSRFAFVALVAIGFVLAVAADRALRGPERTGRFRFMMLAAALLPLVPASAPGIGPTAVPAFFRKGTPGLARERPVLVLPFPRPKADAAMLWQATSGMHFRLIGGYALHPTAKGTASQGPASDALVRVATAASTGKTALAQDLSAARGLLASLGVSAIVVRAGPGSEPMLALATTLTGRGADQAADGVEVWHLQ